MFGVEQMATTMKGVEKIGSVGGPDQNFAQSLAQTLGGFAATQSLGMGVKVSPVSRGGFSR